MTPEQIKQVREALEFAKSRICYLSAMNENHYKHDEKVVYPRLNAAIAIFDTLPAEGWMDEAVAVVNGLLNCEFATAFPHPLAEHRELPAVTKQAILRARAWLPEPPKEGA